MKQYKEIWMLIKQTQHHFKYVKNDLKGKKYIIIKMSDRIRGLIAQNVVNNGDSSVDGLRQRAKELKKLGAKVIDHIV